MSSETKPSVFFRHAAIGFLAVALVAAIAAWPMWQYGPRYLNAMLFAAVICLAAAMVSLVPVMIAFSRRADWLAQACLGGAVIRIFLTLLPALAFYLIFRPPMVTFGLWMTVFYLVLLVWETATAVGFIRSVYGRENGFDDGRADRGDTAAPPPGR